jgi:hypothetical protein
MTLEDKGIRKLINELKILKLKIRRIQRLKSTGAGRMRSVGKLETVAWSCLWLTLE